MKVEVFHNMLHPHDGFIPFVSPACEDCLFRLAYTYESDKSLEDIWIENQRIEGTEAELPERFGTRSLSVGDLVRIDDCEVWTVEVVGWSPVAWDPAV